MSVAGAACSRADGACLWRPLVVAGAQRGVLGHGGRIRGSWGNGAVLGSRGWAGWPGLPGSGGWAPRRTVAAWGVRAPGDPDEGAGAQAGKGRPRTGQRPDRPEPRSWSPRPRSGGEAGEPLPGEGVKLLAAGRATDRERSRMRRSRARSGQARSGRMARFSGAVRLPADEPGPLYALHGVSARAAQDPIPAGELAKIRNWASANAAISALFLVWVVSLWHGLA